MNDCDIVIHMAAIAGVDAVIKNPIKTMTVNLIGIYNVLEAAKKLDWGNISKQFTDYLVKRCDGTPNRSRAAGYSY